MPFLDQMMVSFLFISVIIILISLLDKKESKGLELGREIFRTDKVFNLLSIIIIVLFSVIYIVFW